MTTQPADPTRSSAEPATAPVPPRRRRRYRRLLAIVWLLVATVVLLEVVMQIGAYAVWWMGRRPIAEIPPGQNVVLCVGDSWTHGMGSSDPALHSYPAVLQTLLRERTGRNWAVVNGGLAGQNSRDVLQRLPSQLAEFRPRVLCVLVGMNDYWSCPEPLGEGAAADTIDHTRYHFRWRIPRLAAWIRGKLRDAGQDAAAPPAPRGPEWAPRQVRFEPAYRSLPMKWKSTPESTAHKEEGWRRDAGNDVPGALAEFEQALAAVGDDAQTRQMLVGLNTRSGRSEAAAAHLQWLVDSWTRDQDYWTGSNLALAYDQCGRSQDARDVAVKVLARFPEDGQTWCCRAKSEFHLGRHEEASRSIDEAIRLAPDRWAFFWRYKIHFLGLHDVDEAIRTIFRAYVASNDAEVAAADLLGLTTSADTARLRPVLDAFACEPDVHARLARIVAEVLAAKDGVAAEKVLAQHLRRIATAARNAGAVPVFVPYPVKHQAEEVLRSTAAELEVAFVALSRTFGERLAPRRWDEVRAPDGHCNDEGYRLMAAIVADGLRDIVEATFR